ncbi:MAG TPA: M1 family metallopeptidase [Gemmatimonadaceae bacterium]|jgi:aminopeptidase N
MMPIRRRSIALIVLAAFVAPASLVAQRPHAFTHADTLRGSNGPARAWWKTTFYDLHVRVNPADSSIVGYNGIVYHVLSPSQEMQIDLQPPLVVDSMVQDAQHLSYRRDGNAFFVSLVKSQHTGDRNEVVVYYHGKPVAAKNPPWDGGYIWRHDSLGNRWVSTANEGVGASIWWPNKDIPTEEPDSQRIAITVPDPMVDVSNGRLRSTTHNADGTSTFEWFVVSPINNYSVSVNAGTYAHYSEAYNGEAGKLTMDYWPLAYHLDAAKRQFAQAKSMMACFEHWFGPYPWYEDGYKLVEAPHLGMEHQSAVAYGNHYGNGYLGKDLSATGHGLKWDFIIVHESAHEWWGNSITDADDADMWIHESFANYAENLYTECQEGKQAGAEYVIGTRRLVRNDIPIVGHYGVNDEGSGDKYYKGGNMLHTIRQIVNNDDKWRAILRGAQKTFRHQTIDGSQLEAYFSKEAGTDLSRIFAEYLFTTMIPEFEYKIDGTSLSYHWAHVVPGFDMPLRVALGGDAYTWIKPTEAWQSARLPAANAVVRVDENFYVDVKNDSAPAKP